MQNKSAIWVFTILLVLACLYQLSFSWVTRSFEGNIHSEAQRVCDTIGDAVEFPNDSYQYVLKNGKSLIIVGRCEML